MKESNQNINNQKPTNSVANSPIGGGGTLANPLFPIFLKLENLNTLIVGGGNVGLEKLTAILNNSSKAKVTLVAPLVKEEIFELQNSHASLLILQEKYKTDFLQNKQLVLVATDDKELNKQIKVEAFLANILDRKSVV